MAKKSFFSKLLTAAAKDIFSSPKPPKKVKQSIPKPLPVSGTPVKKTVKSSDKWGKAMSVNRTYRSSDQSRWKSMDFVVGYEIRRSNNPNECDVCLQLAGKYPKWFKWDGWCENCKCNMISILATESEVDTLTELILNGKSTAKFRSINAVLDVPAHFKAYIIRNQGSILSLKKTPKWVKSNFVNGNVSMGLKAIEEDKS